MKIVLMILVGAPAVGKTSCARELVERHGMKDTQFIHVNYDLLLPHRDLGNAEENQWKKDRLGVECQVENFLRDVSSDKFSSLGDQYFVPGEHERMVVIIDDNMYYKSMRLTYYRLAQTFRCGFCQVYFETELETALEANSRRSEIHRVPESSVRNIFSKLEPPNLSNSWERNTVVVKQGGKSLVQFSEVIELAFGQPESMPSLPAVEPKVFNMTHEADGVLRKIVSRRVEDAKKKFSRNEFLSYTQVLMKAKSLLLSDVKGGKIDLPLDQDLQHFLEQVFENYLS